jgi:glycosyltransferase involved in cell wall biosynthesis
MKVLIGANVSAFKGGGIATHVRQVAAGVERLGATVDVLWGRPAPAWMPGPVATARFAHELASAVAAGDYDVVAAQGGEGALLKPGRAARVVTSHGDDRDAWRARLTYAPILMRQRVVTPYGTVPLFRRAVRRADVVIALHEAEADAFRRERCQDASSVHVVPNGCGPPHRDAAPRPGHIVFLGDWLPRKGSLVLPEIFRAVRRERPEASLSLVGADVGVAAQFYSDDRAHVRALGFVEHQETERALASSDALLMPSYHEGMPLAVLEAISFGLPIVGFDVAGTAAAAGRAGLLVQAGDAASCAAALVRVIADRALRRQLSEEAFARCQQLTWAVTAQKTLVAYNDARRRVSRVRNPLRHS